MNGVKWFGPPSLVPAPCTPGEWAEYTVSHTTPAIADFGESGSYFIEKYVFWFSLKCDLQFPERVLKLQLCQLTLFGAAAGGVLLFTAGLLNYISCVA